jgi:hypothetical protein
MTTIHIDDKGAMSATLPGIQVHAFGPRWGKHSGLDWSLASFYKNQELSASKAKGSAVATHLVEIAQARGIQQILLPEPVFGTSICIDTSLQDSFQLEAGQQRTTLRLGMQADICRLRLGDTYVFAPGGCPGVSLYYPGNKALRLEPVCVVAHVGRDSLFDRKYLLEEAPARRHESTIFAMWSPFLRLKPVERKKVLATILFAIPPNLFNHPHNHRTFGKVNRLMHAELSKWGHNPANSQVDLAAIITAQLMHCGIPMTNIESLGSDIAGDPAQWYTTRGPNPRHRNLLLMTHTD